MFDHPKLKLMIDPLQIEQGALSQIAQCLGIDVLEKLVICPDVHQGYDIPIGAAALIRDYIWPGAVGFDINCGMSFINTGLTLNQLSLLKMSDRLEFFEEMKHIVPTNEKGHQKAMGDYRKFPNGASDKEYEKRVLLKASEQLMTLGSGNHFLSIVVNSGDEVGIVLHTGSRKPGWCVGNYWMRFAKKNGVSKNGLWMLPLDSDAGKGYYTDMLWAYDWAHLNRELIMRGVVNLLGLNWKEESLNMINETHNTATILEDNLVLHRKGATPAEDEVYGIIPGNMRDGVFVVKGLGNKEYLSTCSHGAGRKLGRKKAKEKLNWKDLKNEMEAMNIIVDIREDNVDESPNAYKDLWEVVKAQEDLVIEVVDHFSPVIVHIG